MRPIAVPPARRRPAVEDLSFSGRTDSKKEREHTSCESDSACCALCSRQTRRKRKSTRGRGQKTLGLVGCKTAVRCGELGTPFAPVSLARRRGRGIQRRCRAAKGVTLANVRSERSPGKVRDYGKAPQPQLAIAESIAHHSPPWPRGGSIQQLPSSYAATSPLTCTASPQLLSTNNPPPHGAILTILSRSPAVAGLVSG